MTGNRKLAEAKLSPGNVVSAKTTTKSAIARKPAVKRTKFDTEQMPVLVDNPTLKTCDDLLSFSARKARAVTNQINARDVKPNVEALTAIRAAALLGESEVYLAQAPTSAVTIYRLRALGFAVEREEVKDPWPFSIFTRTCVLYKITW